MTDKISGSWPYRKLSAIVLAAAALFLLFHERHISSFDTANFELMLRHGYSVFDDRPQTRGYPGFYILWKCIMWLTGLPPVTVMLCSTVVFGILGIILTFVAGKQLFGEHTAWLATILVITNPLFLFYTRTYAHER
jgi:heme/copper-type cytochrome/quinol oxidase subunit 1